MSEVRLRSVDVDTINYANELTRDIPLVPPELLLSPSLQAGARKSAPAYEVKFILTEEQAQGVEAELQGFLTPDPYNRQTGPYRGYSTTTVYGDTPTLDVFHRRGSSARCKFRVRRYGLDETVFLERKSKRNARVRKRRSAVPLDDLERLAEPVQTESNASSSWKGKWFHERVAARQLAPVISVMYDRVAYLGWCEDRALRLTFDRNIRGQRVSSWDLRPFSGGHSILADRVICEFKFRGSMPVIFKAVIAAFQLVPGNASKFRMCLATSESLSEAMDPAGADDV